MRAVHKNIYKNLINTIVGAHEKNRQKRLVWCGENKWLFGILEILNHVGINVDAVIDNSPMKIGITTKYYTIKKFDYAVERKDDSVFIICSLWCVDMVQQLLSMGIDRKNVYTVMPIEYEVEEFERSVVHKMYNRHVLSITELQDELFQMLLYFRDICESHGLRYYLYDGTLIGAVRHKGFIPWDDDIDVAMPYEDFIKLCNCFKDTEDYSLLSWNRDDDYEYALPRLVSNKTRIVIPDYSVIGCFLDIFLLGGYPEDENAIKAKWKQYKEAEKSWRAYWILKDTAAESQDVREVIFDELFNLPFNESPRVGVMRTERQRMWTAPREWFSETDELEFCGQRFKAPAGYDAYLRMKYGDYMQVPDVESREMHRLLVWREIR